MVKNLVVFDAEGTLINGEMWDLFGKETAEITVRAMNGKLDFKTAVRARFEKIKGTSLDELKVRASSLELFDGAQDLIGWLKKKDFAIGMVSGGFEEVVDKFAKQLSVDYVCANKFILQDDLLVGVQEPIYDPKSKLNFILNLQIALDIPKEKTIVVADGANDILMKDAAGLFIGWNPKEALKRVADTSFYGSDLRVLIPTIDSFIQQ